MLLCCRKFTKPENRLGVTHFPEIVKRIKANTGVDHTFLDSFYEGLTITKQNALSIEACFYKTKIFTDICIDLF